MHIFAKFALAGRSCAEKLLTANGAKNIRKGREVILPLLRLFEAPLSW
jgi:hypothetical protein